jgi:hypothetical protein
MAALASPPIEPDPTCQAFTTWLTQLRGKHNRVRNEIISEMSIIRDGITSNNVELGDFKRHSTAISQQMQAQLTDLREKLTNGFSEITSLVKSKTLSDQDMMKDVNELQQGLQLRTQELEALKRSYAKAQHELQSSLIQIQNQIQVTNSEVQQARASSGRIQEETGSRVGEIDLSLRNLADDLKVGNSENRNQMIQLQDDITRIHEAIANVTAEFNDHKKTTNQMNNKFQSGLWALEEGKKTNQNANRMRMQQQQQQQPGQQPVPQSVSRPPASPHMPPPASPHMPPGSPHSFSGAATVGALPQQAAQRQAQATVPQLPQQPQPMMGVGSWSNPALGNRPPFAPGSPAAAAGYSPQMQMRR